MTWLKISGLVANTAAEDINQQSPARKKHVHGNYSYHLDTWKHMYMIIICALRYVETVAWNIVIHIMFDEYNGIIEQT